MPEPITLATATGAAAALIGTGLGIGFIVRGGAWRPWRGVVWLHAALAAATLGLMAWVVGFGAPTRTEPEGGVSFGVLGLAFLAVAAAMGLAGDRVATDRPGVRGFVIATHAMFAVFGMALVITAAATAAR